MYGSEIKMLLIVMLSVYLLIGVAVSCWTAYNLLFPHATQDYDARDYVVIAAILLAIVVAWPSFLLYVRPYML